MFNIEEMKKELAAIDTRRGPLVALIAAAENYQITVSGSAAGVALARSAQAPQRRAPRNGPVTSSTVALALEMASAYDSPVTTADVVAEMRQRGIALPDKNPTNVVSARLSNSAELEGRRGVGWWPKGKPWPDQAGGHSLLDPQIGHQDGGADVIANA